MPEIRTASRKPKLGQEWSYPLGVGDIEAMLQPHQAADLYLSFDFHPHQAWSKEERDRGQALGEYRLLSCECSQRATEAVTGTEADATWIQERNAQVISVSVYAVPQDALTRGVGLREPIGKLLAEGLTALAPRGIAVCARPKDAWILDLGLDARTHTLQANLRPFNGADYRVSRQLSRVVPPVQERRRI